MKIEQMQFKASGYDTVTPYAHNCLILNHEKIEKYLTFEGIMTYKINKYGRKLMSLTPKDILENNDISVGYQNSIFETIHKYFENGGFSLAYSKRPYLENKSVVVLSKNDINYLASIILKSYIFYKLYNAIIYKCEITEEIKELMKYINISNLSKETLLPKIHEELKQYLLKNTNIKLDLEYYKKTKNYAENLFSFSLICNDWYAYVLYEMIYNLLNDISTDKIIVCQKCGIATIRITNNQKYCKKCSEENKKYDSKEYFAWKEAKKKYDDEQYK